MPQLQWLGDIQQDTGGGYLARALGSGVSAGFQSYAGTKEKEKDRELVSRQLDMQEERLQSQLDRLDTTQKMELVNMTNKIIKMVGDDRAAEMLDDPQIQAIYEKAGVPLPRLPEKGRSMFEQWGAGEEASVGLLNPLRATPWFAYKGGAKPTSPVSTSISVFTSEEEARAAGKKAGNEVSIKGVGRVRLN